MCEKQNKDNVIKDTLLQEYASIFKKNSVPGKESSFALEKFQEGLKTSNFGFIRKPLEKEEGLTDLQKQYRDAFIKSSVPGKENGLALEKFQEGLKTGNFGFIRNSVIEYPIRNDIKTTAKAS
ncbi:hypothetical protein [Clostridium formicaceticum]|uniref:Uncharacterized protein n=1 Tax=Clostridium formicaceticum TaxID=1497 RepID=A0AAC9RM10_9CLOT|nr:hypothetical protein [Clostridium formicaceticum]AOY77489.1 hypothetical protein BJL90_17480 [Clostridium formicaceticum]ARE88052.1 hypothetical protein CLFO_24530 [Clostridium formicaceticum]